MTTVLPVTSSGITGNPALIQGGRLWLMAYAASLFYSSSNGTSYALTGTYPPLLDGGHFMACVFGGNFLCMDTNADSDHVPRSSVSANATAWTTSTMLGSPPNPTLVRGLVEHSGSLYILQFPGSGTIFDGYKSSDGITWTTAPTNLLTTTALNWVFISFGGTLYALPQVSSGSPSVYSSLDGTTWTTIGSLPLYLASITSVVAGGKVYLHGSTTGSVNNTTNQVWSTTDMISFTQETYLASFATRYRAVLVNFLSKLSMLGGLTGVTANKDLWQVNVSAGPTPPPSIPL